MASFPLFQSHDFYTLWWACLVLYGVFTLLRLRMHNKKGDS